MSDTIMTTGDARSWSVATAALTLLYAEAAVLEAFAVEKPLGGFRGTFGSLELYDTMTRLSQISEQVWNSVDRIRIEDVTWDFEFLDDALRVWIEAGTPSHNEGTDDSWNRLSGSLLNALLARVEEPAA